MGRWHKVVLIAALLASWPAMADWAGFAQFNEIAEFSIWPGEIRLNLRLTESTVPSGSDQSGGPTASPPSWLAVRMPKILLGNGKPLAGFLQSINYKTADAMEAKSSAGSGGVSYYEAVLSYPLPDQAEGLSILPPEGESIGLVLLHRGVPMSDMKPLKKPVNLNLDWDDPWRSRIDDPDFVRRHAEPRSYVYIESYEVRHELLVRLNDLKPWLDLGLQDDRYVEESERDALQKKVGAFLMGRNALSIDGTIALPQLDRVEFVRYDQTGVVPVGKQGRLETASALVGVMLVYLTDHPASRIQIQWDLFGDNSGDRQVSFIQGKETFDGYMTPGQSFFEWSRYDPLEPALPSEDATDLSLSAQSNPVKRVPIFSQSWVIFAIIIGLCLLSFKPRLVERSNFQAWTGMFLIVAIGLIFQALPAILSERGPHPPILDDNQARMLLQSLLHNAYRAFQLRDEEKAYDRLAKSLDGDLLDEIYIQQRRAILMRAKGLGGEGSVDRVEVLESHVGGLGQQPVVLQVSSRWLAHGTVSHWGHSHERHNLYQARLTLRNSDHGGWKIVGMEFLDGQSLEGGGAS
jgi:hypothetical protein